MGTRCRAVRIAVGHWIDVDMKTLDEAKETIWEKNNVSGRETYMCTAGVESRQCSADDHKTIRIVLHEGDNATAIHRTVLEKNDRRGQGTVSISDEQEKSTSE